VTAVGALALAASLAYIATAIDLGALADAARAAVADPLGLALALGAYGLAFALRAALWCRALPGLGFGQSLAAIHVSLAGNHLLPLRLGEPLRVVSAVRRAPVPLGAATASAILLRAADVLAVVAIAAVLGPGLAEDLVGGAGVPLAVASAAVLVAAAWRGRCAAWGPRAAGSPWPCPAPRPRGCSRASWCGPAPAGPASTSPRATRPW
jgi:Lysylphosphatidylglycerol synthase TM region